MKNINTSLFFPLILTAADKRLAILLLSINLSAAFGTIDHTIDHSGALCMDGVVGSTLAFGSIGHGFESEHSFLLRHSASAFNKLGLLAKCSQYDSVC